MFKKDKPVPASREKTRFAILFQKIPDENSTYIKYSQTVSETRAKSLLAWPHLNTDPIISALIRAAVEHCDNPASLLPVWQEAEYFIRTSGFKAEARAFLFAMSPNQVDNTETVLNNVKSHGESALQDYKAIYRLDIVPIDGEHTNSLRVSVYPVRLTAGITDTAIFRKLIDA